MKSSLFREEKKMSQKVDIHQQVTDQIISLLDQVELEDYEPPFAMMAMQGLPVNPTTSNTYQGVNILSLWFNQMAKKFTSNEWATFKQWKDAGAQVRKGEKSSRIIFYKTLIGSEKNDKGEHVETKIPMLRTYAVFNANQVEDYTPNQDQFSPRIDKVEKIPLVDSFCSATGAVIYHAEDRAYYTHSGDFINMPETSSFEDTELASATENYYSTLLHELTHWTGAKHRLDRDLKTSIGDQSKYAFEELVAELGAAFLCARFDITQTQPKHHAIYIKSWLKALRNDKTHIFKASAQAAKAVEYLSSPEIGTQ